MKTEKLKDLFLHSITSDLSDEERNIMDNEILGDQSFEAGFRDRVMGIISNRKSFLNKDLMRSFNDVFYNIYLSNCFFKYGCKLPKNLCKIYEDTFTRRYT